MRTEEQVNEGVMFAESCDAGVERWDSPTNSYNTFRMANKNSKQWKDTSFPANESSLWWGRQFTPAHSVAA